MSASFWVSAQNKIEQDWTSFMQVKDASFLKKNIKFKLTAYAKISSADSSAYAGLWARVDNKEGGTDFFDNMNGRRIKSDTWTLYAIEGELNEHSANLSVGGYCAANGKFYFDDFTLMVQNDKGVLENVSLENSGFELPIANAEIPAWTQGISIDQPVHVKGYSFSSVPGLAKGKHALLIDGQNIRRDSSDYIGPYKGFSTQTGVLVSMLNNLSTRIESRVNLLNRSEVDFLLDEKANSIGALIMHLAAAEAYYQVFTFENREFNEEEKAKWQTALDLGEKARKEFTGHDISYYLDIFRSVRMKTIAELQKRDDAWLMKTKPGQPSNYFFWFHVMEHQSSHLGQILLLKKRLPKREEKLQAPKLQLDK